MSEDISLKIEIDDATAQGMYSNLAAIGHSQQEFILDFVFVPPGQTKGKVRSRIIVTPPHAKRLAAALGDNIAKYEARFGPIREEAPPGDGKAGFVH